MLFDEIVKKLRELPIDTWFSVVNKSGDDMTEIIKELIDNFEQFELSNDYKKFKRLYDHFSNHKI